MLEKEEFRETLNYCLYICDNGTEIFYDLINLQLKDVAGLITEKDFKQLLKLERKLQKQFRD